MLACFAAATLSVLVPLQDDGDAALAARFGFAGFEIYRFERGIRALSTADFDADGRADLALLDEARSRIAVLLRLIEGAPDHAGEPEPRGSGASLRFDGRFDIVHVPVERRVLALHAADLDGDGRGELVYALEGGDLVLVDRIETRAPVRTMRRIDELRGGCALLDSADLDGDGRREVLAASEDTLLALPVRDGAFGDERQVDRVAPGLDQLHVLDLDGDGLSDLAYAYLEEEHPLRLRMGLPGGGLGPRFDPELPPLRSLTAADLDGPDGPGRAELAVVFRISGRCAVLGVRGTGGVELARTTLETLAKDSKRAFAVGDLDADGAAEIAVSEGAAARVVLWRGERGARVLAAQSSASLVEAAHPRIGDVHGDGRNELVLVSGVERMVGISSVGPDGALAFPDTLGVTGEPAALEVADLDGDGAAEIAVVATSGEGRARTASLLVWKGSASGPVTPPTATPLEGLAKAPSALRAADLDADGKTDLVVLVPGESEVPLFLVQRPDGAFTVMKRGEGASGLGVLAGAGAERFARADIDGDGAEELLVAARNFARALRFPRAGQGVLEPDVIAQFNGPGADSRISAAVAADWDGDGEREIVLRDERTRELVVQRRGDGEPRELARIDADRIDFRGLEAADVDGDGRTDLVVLGQQELGVAYAGSAAPRIEEEAAYETTRRELYLERLATADLDGDGRREIVACETFEHALLLLAREERTLRHALGFRVFESALFDQDDEGGREPRELVAADLSGDGRTDLALLVHDKLLVYLQE